MQQQQDRIIERYTTALAHGENMLYSAHRGAWEDLISEEGNYVAVIEELAEIEQAAQLDEAARKRKLELLDRIRNNEEQLRDMLQSRMGELSEMMTQSQTELRVQQAYEPTVAGR